MPTRRAASKQPAPNAPATPAPDAPPRGALWDTDANDWRAPVRRRTGHAPAPGAGDDVDARVADLTTRVATLEQAVEALVAAQADAPGRAP
jgi:hypothetical protein